MSGESTHAGPNGATPPPGYNPGDDGQTWSPALAALWDALPEESRELIQHRAPDVQRRDHVATIVLALHARPGWTVALVVEMAGYWPNGLGCLDEHTEGTIIQEWGWQDAAREKARSEDAARPLWSAIVPWNEADLPCRPWIVKGYLLRGSVTIVAGPPSAGKSSLIKAWCVALALGLPFHRFRPPGPLRVLSYGIEDDLNEERLRISAVLRQFGKTPADLGANLMLVGPRDVGTLLERDPATGSLVATDALKVLEQFIIAFQPDVVIADPFVELHTVEENDNTGQRQVVGTMRSMATVHRFALAVAHHTRKGAIEPGDPEAIRGAGAIVGAVRVALTVCTMGEEDAEALGVPIEHRRNFFRVDGAKSNYSALGEPEWFERIAYSLDNGEEVAAAVPWRPATKTATSDDHASLVARIGAAKVPYSPRLSTVEKRSILPVLIELGFVTRKDQQAVLRAIESAGLVERVEFIEPRRSKDQPSTGLRTAAGLPSADWIEA